MSRQRIQIENRTVQLHIYDFWRDDELSTIIHIYVFAVYNSYMYCMQCSSSKGLNWHSRDGIKAAG